MADAHSRVPIERVAFGIRYAPQYRVRDTLGVIIDAILRSDPFNPDVFPESQVEPSQHTLLNPTNGDRLTITQADALLDITLKTSELAKVSGVAKHFNTIVVKELKHFCNIGGAFRFGLLMRFAELPSDAYECPAKKYADEAISSHPAKKLSLQSSYTLPTQEGFTKRGVEDYRSVIYTMNQEEPDRFSIAVDYQHYFDPLLSAQDWSAPLYERFVDGALAYHQSTVSKWVDTLARKEVRDAA